MTDVKLSVGGSLEDDAAAFVDAWHRAARGKPVHERVLVFDSCEGLAKVVTGERYRLLRHLHRHPAPSVSALARRAGAAVPARPRRCGGAGAGWAAAPVGRHGARDGGHHPGGYPAVT